MEHYGIVATTPIPEQSQESRISDLIKSLDYQLVRYEKNLYRLVEANNRLMFPDATEACPKKEETRSYAPGHIGELMRVLDVFISMNEAFDKNLEKTAFLV